jgi:hypothetical protein
MKTFNSYGRYKSTYLTATEWHQIHLTARNKQALHLQVCSMNSPVVETPSCEQNILDTSPIFPTKGTFSSAVKLHDRCTQ